MEGKETDSYRYTDRLASTLNRRRDSTTHCLYGLCSSELEHKQLQDAPTHKIKHENETEKSCLIKVYILQMNPYVNLNQKIGHRYN